MLHRLSTPGAPPVPGVRISPRGTQAPSAAPASAASCNRLTGMRPGGSGRSATTRGTSPARRVDPEDLSPHRASSHQRQSTPGHPAELVHAAPVQGQAVKECHFGRGVAPMAFPDQEVGSIRHEGNNREFPLCSQPRNQQGIGSGTLRKTFRLPDKRCGQSGQPRTGTWASHTRYLIYSASLENCWSRDGHGAGRAAGVRRFDL